MKIVESLQTKIPPPVYGLLTALLIWWLSHLAPFLSMIPQIISRSGMGLIIIGLAIDLLSLAQFFKNKTTPNPLAPDKTSKLVNTGLYRYTRNPMYLGMLIALTGWVLYLGNVAGFVCLPIFMWVLTTLQIVPEERILGEKFGAEYRDYINTVGRWL